MKKFLIGLVMMIVGVMGLNAMSLTPAYAEGCDEYTSAFFSLRPWYAGLQTGDNCEIQLDSVSADGKELSAVIWGAVLNIMYDITVIVGYLAILMIAWGGYLYMFSRGMPDRAERGKKTLIAAIAGLAIAMLASVILNTIVTVLTN